MTFRRDWLYLAALVAAAALLYRCDASANRRYGALDAHARNLEAANDALRADAVTLAAESARWRATTDSTDRVLASQKATMDAAVAHWRRLAGVLPETVTVVENVPRDTSREGLIAAANAAVTACTDAFRTCEATVRARDSVIRSDSLLIISKDRIISNRDSALVLERRMRPGLFDKVRTAVVYLAAGYLAGVVTK